MGLQVPRQSPREVVVVAAVWVGVEEVEEALRAEQLVTGLLFS